MFVRKKKKKKKKRKQREEISNVSQSDELVVLEGKGRITSSGTSNKTNISQLPKSCFYL